MALATLPVYAADPPLTLADMRARLAALPLQNLRATAGGMSPQVALVHCAQSIEYALTGYPRLKPRWFRQTLGQSAARVFLWRNRVSHDLHEPIPGAPVIVEGVALAGAVTRLLAAIETFEAAIRAGKPLAPHFAYGVLASADYDRLQALHLQAHLAALQAA
ncbi:DUF1569 domain-containing protein [Chitinimonas sp. BJYL2]|uniref:DUF1569 domain-containing protein n=1 Tax=Chitinimonas sp. BJYL2 TaxID=2976696 RepID=UPI0022B4C6A8|nr:DUF1569 domain-containing protein [Chitinimonas sp. BJYL2]